MSIDSIGMGVMSSSPNKETNALASLVVDDLFYTQAFDEETLTIKNIENNKQKSFKLLIYYLYLIYY